MRTFLIYKLHIQPGNWDKDLEALRCSSPVTYLAKFPMSDKGEDVKGRGAKAGCGQLSTNCLPKEGPASALF